MFLAVGLSGCLFDNKIIGTWENTDSNLKMTIKNDGTITYLDTRTSNLLKGTYELTENVIKITFTAELLGETHTETQEVNYELIDDDTLWISPKDNGSSPMTFNRIK